MSLGFNENSEKSRFIFKPSPVNPMAYQIFENEIGDADYTPVGEYLVLDREEDKSLTEKKLINLISLMNGRKNVVDHSAEVDTQLLFQVLPRKNDDDPTKIMFRTRDEKSVSVENALLQIKRGIIVV